LALNGDSLFFVQNRVYKVKIFLTFLRSCQHGEVKHELLHFILSVVLWEINLDLNLSVCHNIRPKEFNTSLIS
jgi:hypothetical protein